MRSILILLLLAHTCGLVFGQSPQAMSFQAVIRDGNSVLLADSTVGIQISILQGSVNGSSSYVERHTPTTNGNGLATFQIGNGMTVSGNFATIDWSNGPYFLQTETDLTGGVNYTITGTSQLLSVPYALHAETAGAVNETDPVFGASVAAGITGVDTANWNTDLVDDTDADPGNEIQTLLYDSTNQELSISGGNVVPLNGLTGPIGPVGPQGPIGPVGPAGAISLPGYNGTGLVTFMAERFPEEDGGQWYHTSVIMENGEVKMWGYNQGAVMGIGDQYNINIFSPRVVPLCDSVISMTGNGLTTFFTLKDSSLWAAGWNGDGQAGVGSTATRIFVPEPVANISGVKKVVVAQANTYTTQGPAAAALLNNGQVWCWGHNPFGQLGNGTFTSSNVPVRAGIAINMQDVTDIDMGGRNWASTCALRSDTSLWCWGRNNHGQLGTGNTINQPAPVPVFTSSDTILKIVSEGDADQCSRYMLKQDGTIWAWGSNHYGQLGIGTTSDSHFPVQVPGINNAIDVFTGGGHQPTIVALLADSTIRTWGANGLGQCGIGNSTNQFSPVDPGISGVKTISIAGDGQANIGGHYHTVYMLKHNGTVWGMGNNTDGQLGNGNSAHSYIPTQILGIKNANSIRASGLQGATTCCAILEDGRVKCWGHNANTQVGEGTTTNIRVPTLVKDLNE